jgi:hypothetical protein
MADCLYVAQNTVFSAATGAKTVLNVIAGANQPIQIVEWGVSFDGVASSAVPATVNLCQSTQAGAGTSGGSVPAVVQITGRSIPAQFTVGHNYTAEPTALTVLEEFFVSQYNGMFVRQYPQGQEPETDVSSGTIKALALRVNTSATVNCLAFMKVEIGA